LAWLELEAFRGFATKRRLDLDADVVLVRGDNGTGKTSITDGLLWLMTGEIPRLRERAKGLRKGEGDPIVNRYRHGEEARVRLGVRIGPGATDILEFERKGRGKDTTLRGWRDEEEIEDAESELPCAFGDFTPQQFAQGVSSWGILQQHALLDALDNGTSMHERLAEVVGLERVDRFAASAAEVAKAARNEQKRAQALLESLLEKRRAASERLQEARREPMEEKSHPGARISKLVLQRTSKLPAEITLSQAVEELEHFPELMREVDELWSTARALGSAGQELALAGDDGTEAIEEAEERLRELKQRAEEAVAKAPAKVQLADAALRLLGDECPVCGQEIDEGSVRAHLNELRDVAKEESELAEATRRAAGDAEARLQSARLAEARREEAQKHVDASSARLRESLDGAGWVAVDPSWASVERAQDLSEALEYLDSRLRDAQAEARRTSSARMVRLSADVESTSGELERAEAEVKAIEARSMRAAALNKAAHQAAERIIERALRRLQPSLAEVFDRLAPHPTFKELLAKQDIYYGRNQVVPQAYDPEHGVGGHPKLIFSEGQLNVVALSYFLGLALNAGEGALPFIVLDDTLQTMDVLNVLGFADLCRRLREERQLILTTHDRRFASLLARKLAPREEGTRTILHELDGWTEEGPLVRSGDEPLAEVVPLPERRAS
jgi:DNA repair exonuclease SbcCD ATPase subunit